MSSSRFLRASTSSLRMILQNHFEQTNLGWCRRESTRNRCRDRCATRASQPRWTSTRSSFPRDRSWRSDSFAPLSSGLFQMPQNVPISPEKHPVKRSQNPGKMLRRLVELVGIEPTHRSQRWRLPSYLLYLSRLSSRVRSTTVQFKPARLELPHNFVTWETEDFIAGKEISRTLGT